MPAQAWSMAMASVFVMMSHTRDIRSSLDMLKPSTSGLDTMHHAPKCALCHRGVRYNETNGGQYTATL